jgi:Ca2+-binding EF-hand superfamily protein
MSKKGRKSAKLDLSDEYRQEIEDAFALCDPENTGTIDIKELKVSIQRFPTIHLFCRW